MLSSIMVQNTVTLVVAGGNRAFVWIKNISNKTVYFKIDGSADALTVQNGFPLAAGGLLVQENNPDDIASGRALYTQPISAIVNNGDQPAELRIQVGL